MSVDYREVLKDLEDREMRLAAELEEIRLAKPVIQRMAAAMPIQRIQLNVPPALPQGPYAGLGTRDAVLLLLSKAKEPLTVAKIAHDLIQGGIKTKSADFPGVVASTLGQLKTEGKVARKESGWILTMSPSQLEAIFSEPLSLQ